MKVVAESGTNTIENDVDALGARVDGVWPEANWNSWQDEVMAVIVVVVVPVLVTEILFEGALQDCNAAIRLG